MTEKSTAVTVVEKFQVPALSGNIVEAFGEEMDGLSIDFDRVKIPSGGGLAFELPGEDDDDYKTEKTITGIIVYHHPTNAYWADSYSGANNPPDCSSIDGKTGIVTATGEKVQCASCRYNQWGSETRPDGSAGRGKACKNMRRLYILRDGEMFPLLLTLPPTSLKNFGNFVAKRVLGRGLRTIDVLTEVSLKKATSGDGISYSQARFRVVGRVPEDRAAELKAYADSIRAVSRNLAVGADDFGGSNDNEDDLVF